MRILVIEDEAGVREVLISELQDEGFEVMGLENGEGVLMKMSQFKPDVLILDQMMPGKSGNEVIKEIRGSVDFNNIPIMLITALVGESDKVKSFDLGADDYITKPFMLREVVARVRALVRRAESSYKQEQKQLTYKDLAIDFSAHRVILKGSEVPLTLTEFKILGELVKQSGQVLSRDNLRERALGNLNVTDRTIDVHMASLRKKLDHLGDCIETVRGVGYRFTK